MLLARSVLALAFVAGGCSVARAAAPAPTPSAAAPPPAASERRERPDDVVAARVAVNYHDVHALASVLKDIFGVRPDRGDVRAILHDGREAVLIVFATPAGHASVLRVIDRLLAPTGS
jgi:hypothetical protein